MTKTAEPRPNTWYDVLTDENLDDVVRWLSDLLVGKKYAVVTVFCGCTPPRVETRIENLVAEWCNGCPDPIRGIRGEAKDYFRVGFAGNGGYYYDFDAHSDGKDPCMQDPTSHNTYVKFQGDTVTFTCRARAGDICIHQFTVVGDLKD
jgi:hypothetical protein